MRKVITACLLSIITLICLYLFLHSSFFNVERIYVTGNKEVSEEEILEIADIFPGINIFEVDNRLCSKAIELHPMIKKAQVIRHLPRSIEIRVEERTIWAVIPYNDVILCVDEEGVCIDRRPNFPAGDYPIITMEKMPAKINLGQAVQPAGMKMMYQIWSRLTPDMKRRLSDFHYINSKKEVVIYTSLGTEVKFGSDDRLEEKMELLEKVLKLEEEFNNKGNEAIEYVDLRFKGQPVVKTKD
ncbi:cell division protein FtsQ [Thermosyntropha lipolytica DSM 11003]|uniref:Cell division protein FtsQ n=1 Tax=Thermosyntropha lipolytica DSM 11003 TaxID=1123382 RepID=A0A1M5NZC6_9FIRM|nr:FtsQ-type POTRA domain-containing protein [Thermosyntropha lipolytica]SHG94323.1 cell division protein FtsQ [Thermosyntropha lipolytica DSM 11003]